MEKLISSNGNLYKVVMISTGKMFFYVRAGYSFRQLHTAPVIARITAAMVEADHAEALEMDDKFDGAIRDNLTPEQRAIERKRMGIDIYGEGYMASQHAEALEMDAEFNAEAARRRKLSVMRTIQNEIMEKPYLPALVEACHVEALEINAQVDSDLAKLCRVIAGVRRTLYRQEVKQDLIGAACRGVVDGLRERLGVIISRDMLPVITVRAAK